MSYSSAMAVPRPASQQIDCLHDSSSLPYHDDFPSTDEEEDQISSLSDRCSAGFAPLDEIAACGPRPAVGSADETNIESRQPIGTFQNLRLGGTPIQICAQRGTGVTAQPPAVQPTFSFPLSAILEYTSHILNQIPPWAALVQENARKLAGTSPSADGASEMPPCFWGLGAMAATAHLGAHVTLRRCLPYGPSHAPPGSPRPASSASSFAAYQQPFDFLLVEVPSSSGQEQQQQQQQQQGSAKSTLMLVQPGFRDLFATAHQTFRYRKIWSMLPEVFVGRLQTLDFLMRLASVELKLSSEELCCPLPPWRSYEVMSTRWRALGGYSDVRVPSFGPAGETPSKAELQRFFESCDARVGHSFCIGDTGVGATAARSSPASITIGFSVAGAAPC